MIISSVPCLAHSPSCHVFCSCLPTTPTLYVQTNQRTCLTPVTMLTFISGQIVLSVVRVLGFKIKRDNKSVKKKLWKPSLLICSCWRESGSSCGDWPSQAGGSEPPVRASQADKMRATCWSWAGWCQHYWVKCSCISELRQTWYVGQFNSKVREMKQGSCTCSQRSKKQVQRAICQSKICEAENVVVPGLYELSRIRWVACRAINPRGSHEVEMMQRRKVDVMCPRNQVEG